jgi:hypothetical protein
MPTSGPYPPQAAALGGSPTVKLDVPISAVLLFLYVLMAITNMTILQLNLRRGHKFLLSGLLFGFCMARIVTMIMRIVWATRPTNIRVAIAASVFVSAGIVILFIINLLFAQRILRATHPHFAWHKFFSRTYTAFYVSIIVILAIIITVAVQSFYTLSKHTLNIDHTIQHVASCYFTAMAFMPIPFVLFAIIIPRHGHLDKFGSGRFRTKIFIILTSAFLLTLGAAFRTATQFYYLPRNRPAWFDSKACFYCFNFVIELVVLFMYAVMRVDFRFWVPDSAKHRHTYQAERGRISAFYTDEEVMDEADANHPVDDSQEKDMEQARIAHMGHIPKPAAIHAARASHIDRVSPS